MMDNPVPLFRFPTTKDADQLADLRWRLQTDDAEAFDAAERISFIDSFIKLFSRNELQDYHHWVADLEGRLVAVMSVYVVRQLPAPQRLKGSFGYLTNCYVLPEYRNHGIGGKLLERVRLWSKEQDFELLVVWPSDRSYPFYKRSGFDKYSDPLVLKLHTDV